MASGALPFEDLLPPFRVGSQVENLLVVLHHLVPLVRRVGLKQIQGPVPNRFIRMLGEQDPVVLLQGSRLHGPPFQRVQQTGRASAVGDQGVKGGSPLPGGEGAPPGEDQPGDLHVVVSSHDLENLGAERGIGNGIQKVSENGTRVPKSDTCQRVDRLHPVPKREVRVQGLTARLCRQPRHPEIPGHTGRRHSDTFGITFQEFTEHGSGACRIQAGGLPHFQTLSQSVESGFLPSLVRQTGGSENQSQDSPDLRRPLTGADDGREFLQEIFPLLLPGCSEEVQFQEVVQEIR